MAIAAPTHGSDTTGILCCYRFHPAEGSRALDAAEVERRLLEQREPAPGEFLWLHLNLSHAGSEKWLRRHGLLSAEFHELLHEGTRSTRIDYADDSLLAVINDVLFDFSFDTQEISTLYLCVRPHLAITARSKPLRSIDRLREAVKRGDLLDSPVDLLVHLLRDQADVLIQITRELADAVDSVEDRLLVNRLDRKPAQLGAWRRLLVRLQRLMAPEPSALFRLLNRPPAWVSEPDVSALRQSTEEYSTVLRDMLTLQERIKLLQEEVAALTNEQTNRSLFVLTVISVMVLPINIISGLLGMNVGGIPLAGTADGFWVVVALVATLTAVAAWFAFRERD